MRISRRPRSREFILRHAPSVNRWWATRTARSASSFVRLRNVRDHLAVGRIVDVARFAIRACDALAVDQ